MKYWRKLTSWWALRHMPVNERRQWVSIVGEDAEGVEKARRRWS